MNIRIHKNSTHLPCHQTGVVLFVGLIMLVVLTLIGVTGMRTTNLEERMAGNAIDKNIALQAAEAGLRAGEAILGQASLPAFNNSNGYYQASDPGSDPIWETVTWTSEAIQYDTDGSKLGGAQAYYILEELPVVGLPGESLAADTPADELGHYRVTARGSGKSGTAITMVQSTYRR